MIVEIETSTTQCELWIPQYGINKTCYTWFPSLLGTGQYEMSGVLVTECCSSHPLPRVA